VAGVSRAELVVLDGGWRESLLGPSPFDVWCAALEDTRPALERAKTRWGCAAVHR